MVLHLYQHHNRSYFEACHGADTWTSEGKKVGGFDHRPEQWVRRCACGWVILAHGVIILDVFLFMLSVDSLNQMINPLPRQQGFTGSLPRILACRVIASPEVGPTTRLTGSPRVQGGNLTREIKSYFFTNLRMQEPQMKLYLYVISTTCDV